MVVPDDADPMVRERCHGLPDVLARAVIDDDDIEIHAMLIQNCAQRQLEQSNAVVGRNDDADFRSHEGAANRLQLAIPAV